jgi:tripartite-type tricarboxylate transporter receptor subunit TctC
MEETTVKSLIAVLAAVIGAAFGSSGASAQQWPTRPVTLIVPFAAGGATDAIARALAQRMSEGLGQQVVVENRAGAAGALGAQAAAKAAPDGHTILMATTSTHVILPLTQTNLGYDAQKDFAPIGMVATAPNILIASPKLSANSIPELIAYAKANPGKVNFASSGQGTITHLIGELFNIQAGIQAVHVPYKTGVQSFAELNDGQVHFLFDSIVWSLPQIRAGKLKGLGITSAQRSSLAPDLPSLDCRASRA